MSRSRHPAKTREEWRDSRSCDKHYGSSAMKEIRLKLSDVFEVDPAAAEIQADIANITAYVLKHYSFLPLPIAVTVDGDEVVITFRRQRYRTILPQQNGVNAAMRYCLALITVVAFAEGTARQAQP